MLHLMRADLGHVQSTGNSLQVPVLRIAQKQQQSKRGSDSESLFGLSEERQVSINKWLISCQILGKSAIHCPYGGHSCFCKKYPSNRKQTKDNTFIRKRCSVWKNIYTVFSVLLNLVIIGQACFQLPSDDSHDLLILPPICPFM